jgi:uncharacterized repeat protein (TIGR04076 family)
MREVVATVKSGRCNGGFHRVGDRFVIGDLTPAKMCTWAFGALFPSVLVLQCGGEFFWEKKDKRITRVSCPGPKGLVFEVRLRSGQRK